MSDIEIIELLIQNANRARRLDNPKAQEWADALDHAANVLHVLIHGEERCSLPS
jgi:hypothetical protein